MRLWVDDLREAPEGYVWCKSVEETKTLIEITEEESSEFYNKAMSALKNHRQEKFNMYMTFCKRRDIELIDVDHDAGDYAWDGGDYIRLLDWLEETGRNYPIRIHSQNPVGVENMRRIIERNGWREIK